MAFQMILTVFIMHNLRNFVKIRWNWWEGCELASISAQILFYVVKICNFHKANFLFQRSQFNNTPHDEARSRKVTWTRASFPRETIREESKVAFTRSNGHNKKIEWDSMVRRTRESNPGNPSAKQSIWEIY